MNLMAVRRLFCASVLASLLVASLPMPAVAAAEKLDPARDLQRDARLAVGAGVPLIVMVSLADCPHCEVVRRSHLLPLLRLPPGGTRWMIRQVELNGSDVMTGFNGEQMTHAEFARRNKVSIAPVVLFFGANGDRLADPLVGAMIADFYGAYFDTAVEKATAMIRAGSQSR